MSSKSTLILGIFPCSNRPISSISTPFPVASSAHAGDRGTRPIGSAIDAVISVRISLSLSFSPFPPFFLLFFSSSHFLFLSPPFLSPSFLLCRAHLTRPPLPPAPPGHAFHPSTPPLGPRSCARLAPAAHARTGSPAPPRERRCARKQHARPGLPPPPRTPPSPQQQARRCSG